MIWCGECGYKGKGLYLENEVYCPYCKATGNDIVALPIDNNTKNLTDEETDIYNSWLEAKQKRLMKLHCYKEVMKMTRYDIAMMCGYNSVEEYEEAEKRDNEIFFGGLKEQKPNVEKEPVKLQGIQEKKYCRMIPLEPDCRGYTDVFICTNCHQHIHLGFIRKEYSGSFCIECGAEVKDGEISG